MKLEREPYVRIIVGIVAVAAIPPLGLILFEGSESLAVLKDWQSGVGAFWGALFGLGAILIGALFNADLNRRRDDRLREQEARALAAALRAEISAAAADIYHAYQICRDSGDTLPPDARDKEMLLSYLGFPVYDAAATKLGLLDENLAGDVVKFYRSAKRAIIHLAEIGPGEPPYPAAGSVTNIFTALPLQRDIIVRHLTEFGGLKPED